VGHQMLIRVPPESFSEPVAHMPDHDKNNIADICTEQDVVRGILLFCVLEWLSGRVSAGVTVALIGAVTEFDVSGGKCGGIRGRGNTLRASQRRVQLEHVILRVRIGYGRG
jgi:hypothetical protein